MSVEDRYYKLIRIMLKFVGIWPYQNTKWADIRAILIAGIFLSTMFNQLGVFLTNNCTLDLILEIFSILFLNIYVFLMHSIYYSKSNVMREMMERMYSDWKNLKSETELNIMGNYASVMKQFTELAFYLICLGIVTLLTYYAGLIVLEFTSPLNETRIYVHIKLEYFIDPQKFRYLIIVHVLTAVVCALFSTIGTGLAYFSYCFHACAMFKIANSRVEFAMEKSVLQISNPMKEYIIYKRIVNAVDAHRKAIRYCDQLIANLDKLFLFSIIIGVASLSINLFRLLKVVTIYSGLFDFIIPCFLVIGHFVFIFFGNYLGQQVTNNNAEIFNTVYNLPWYLAPPNIQKLLIFLLQKSHKEFYLTFNGVLNASYEFFATLIKVSISYFTVIYAMQ